MNDIQEAKILWKRIDEYEKQGPERIKDAIRLGQILTEHKSKISHGGWLKYLETTFGIPDQRDSEFRRFYKYRDKLPQCGSLIEAKRLVAGLGQRKPRSRKTDAEKQAGSQQYWDKHQREELEKDVQKRQKADGIVHEFPAYQTEWDQFWNRIMDQHPREKQIEIAQELIENLWKRYPEIGGSSFRVVERDN